MPTFEIDDQFAFHQKTVMAGNEAIGVWARAGSWCAGYLTDGSVPRDIAGTLGGQSLWTKLINVGLVEETPDGYQLHDYLHWNRPASAILDDRRRAAEKKRDQRAKLRADSKCPPGTSKGTPPGRPRACPPPVPPSPAPAPSPAPSQSDHICDGPESAASVEPIVDPPKPPKPPKPFESMTGREQVIATYFAEYERARGEKPPMTGREWKSIDILVGVLDGNHGRAMTVIRNAFADLYWQGKITINKIANDPAKFDGQVLQFDRKKPVVQSGGWQMDEEENERKLAEMYAEAGKQ